MDSWVQGQPGLQDAFQDSQGCREKPYLEKQKQKQTKKGRRLQRRAGESRSPSVMTMKSWFPDSGQPLFPYVSHPAPCSSTPAYLYSVDCSPEEKSEGTECIFYQTWGYMEISRKCLQFGTNWFKLLSSDLGIRNHGSALNHVFNSLSIRLERKGQAT